MLLRDILLTILLWQIFNPLSSGEVCLSQPLGAHPAYLISTLASETSNWWLGIGHGGNLYTMKTGRYDQFTSTPLLISNIVPIIYNTLTID